MDIGLNTLPENQRHVIIKDHFGIVLIDLIPMKMVRLGGLR